MDDFPDRLWAKQLAGLHLSGDMQTVCDERHGREQDITVGAWKECWWPGGGHSASEQKFYFSNSDSPYVYCYEEVEYEQRLGDIVAHICRNSGDDWSIILENFLAVSRLYDLFCAIASWVYWVHNMDFEIRPCSIGGCMFLG